MFSSFSDSMLRFLSRFDWGGGGDPVKSSRTDERLGGRAMTRELDQETPGENERVE